MEESDDIICAGCGSSAGDRQMNAEEREQLIEQLVRSFIALPLWAKRATQHALAAPTINPETGLPFESFREVLGMGSNEALLTLKDDFADNGDLLP